MKTQRTVIGRSFKTSPPFGKFSDSRVTPGPQRLSLNWGGSGRRHTWGIVLQSMGYQVLKIYSPARFRKFLQGVTLSGADWLPPNQARRLSNLLYSFFLCLAVQVFPVGYGDEVSTGIGQQS